MASIEENAYQVLGLGAGPESTENEIKKAYRKLALIKHPDKNPDNSHAATEFNAIQRAYDLLLDPDARAALDGLLKAKALREERFNLHDDKRRRMAEELLRKERAADQGISQEAAARARLQKEIERMKRVAAEKRAARKAMHGASTTESLQKTVGTGTGVSHKQSNELDAITEQSSRTLKVTWLRQDNDEYTSTQLQEIFQIHGPVEDIVIKDSKKKKGSALVVMKSVDAARAACATMNGTRENPLLVVPLGENRDQQEKYNNGIDAVHDATQSAPAENRKIALDDLLHKRERTTPKGIVLPGPPSKPLFAASMPSRAGAVPASLFAAARSGNDSDNTKRKNGEFKQTSFSFSNT